jgi:hypothetical protein
MYCGIDYKNSTPSTLGKKYTNEQIYLLLLLPHQERYRAGPGEAWPLHNHGTYHGRIKEGKLQLRHQ